MPLPSFLSQPEYNFLFDNPRLGQNIILLTYGGSYAYGTNTAGSDIDIRGCTLNQRSDLLGMTNCEQIIDNQTDTTIYAFNKLVTLLAGCNPNIIEMLGCKPEHYFVLTDVGKALIENRSMFLSQRAAYTFGSYATQQLRRLQNALARDEYTQAEKERHMLGSCQTAMASFDDRYQHFENGSLRLFLDKSTNPDMEQEIYIDASLTHYPLRDYKNMMADMASIIRDYDKLNKRNHKKDDAHLNKHAMHLVRLYFMCFDILEKGQVVTYREKEHDLLMSIRNGAFQQPDKSFRPEFFEMVDKMERRMQYDIKNTSLPRSPDAKKIEDFVISVNERIAMQDPSLSLPSNQDLYTTPDTMIEDHGEDYYI